MTRKTKKQAASGFMKVRELTWEEATQVRGGAGEEGCDCTSWPGCDCFSGEERAGYHLGLSLARWEINPAY